MSEKQKSISPNYQFTNKLSHNKYLYCPNCHSLMLKPLRIHKCGHTFCSKCLDDSKIKKCYICLEKILAKQQDILATRLVGELEVKCKNDGCPWKGTLENYKLKHQEKCQLREGGIQAWLKGLQDIIKDKNNQNNMFPDSENTLNHNQQQLELFHTKFLQSHQFSKLALTQTQQQLKKQLLTVKQL